MHQFCRQHLEMHCNAEIKLVCSESYYDRLLLICGGPMVDAAARRALSNITERMFRDIWETRAQHQ